MKIRRIHVLVVILGLAICTIPFRAQLRLIIAPLVQHMKGQKTVADRVAQYGSVVRTRLDADFARAGVSYPPKFITLVALKDERTLEVWVAEKAGAWRRLRTYPILGLSGVLGPKLASGDMQVPEGIYSVESLNPNSLYHLALRLNYPNEFDLAKGKEDGRENLGSDIMIHGNTCSIGCLAMGDEAAEDLFVLAALTGIRNITVVLAPVDFRTGKTPDHPTTPPRWTDELYKSIKKAMEKT